MPDVRRERGRSQQPLGCRSEEAAPGPHVLLLLLPDDPVALLRRRHLRRQLLRRHEVGVARRGRGCRLSQGILLSGRVGRKKSIEFPLTLTGTLLQLDLPRELLKPKKGGQSHRDLKRRRKDCPDADASLWWWTVGGRTRRGPTRVVTSKAFRKASLGGPYSQQSIRTRRGSSNSNSSRNRSSSVGSASSSSSSNLILWPWRRGGRRNIRLRPRPLRRGSLWMLCSRWSRTASP